MKRRDSALGLVCALAAFGAGCGGGSAADAGTDAQGLQTLKVGVIPIADVAPLYLGMERGFFEREGLKIEPEPAQGGAAIVPKVVSGEEQFGFSNAVSLVIASAKGLPVEIVSQGDQAGGSSGLFVAKGSGIADPGDLEGKTVGVITLNNIATLVTNRAVEQAGGDYRKVDYVEVPFPEMQAAIEQGRVDAGVTVEPFTTFFAKAGLEKISLPFEELDAKLTVATYFATKQYVAENRDIVERFVRALHASLAYAQDHPEEVRRIVTSYTEIPPEIAHEMGLPHWSTDLNWASIELQADLAARYGYVDQAPRREDLISDVAVSG